MAEEPKLVRRRENRKSTIMSGRTIGEARERLETKNERVAARKKDKKKKTFRISFTVIGFALLTIILIGLCFSFLSSREDDPVEIVTETPAELTIKVVDEDANATSGKITSRMETYLAEVEQDFRELGYKATKAVIPTGSVRTVHLYLEGRKGYIKMTIDRGSGVSVEDADRLIRYLAAQGTNDFEYLDVRTPGKAYWK